VGKSSIFSRVKAVLKTRKWASLFLCVLLNDNKSFSAHWSNRLLGISKRYSCKLVKDWTSNWQEFQNCTDSIRQFEAQVTKLRGCFKFNIFFHQTRKWVTWCWFHFQQFSYPLRVVYYLDPQDPAIWWLQTQMLERKN
jgi:hypothetical protein